MPIFTYSARNRAGEKVDGDLDANDRRSALMDLERKGLMPVKVEERAAAAAKAQDAAGFTLWHGRKTRMGMRDVLLFTSELSDLLASGMTLANALNSLAGRRAGRAEDSIIGSLRDEIIRGTSLSDALALHPESFSRLYVNMIKAGEASGALDEVLGRLVEHFERMQELKEKVVMALTYPLIVLFMGVLVLAFSMIWVIPKFELIFQQMNQALPLPTRILMGLSTFTVRYGWLVAALLGALAVAANTAIRTDKGRLVWHGLILRTPLVKRIVASGIYANFARTLGTLLSNGVPVLQALGVVEQTVGNVVIAQEIRNARERVTDGTTISGPLAAGQVFPPIMTDMLAIGEQTGDMPSALKHIAKRCENDLDRSIKILTTALEPILIIGIAFAVGFVAISILMAVFELTSGINT
jgi:general secretion pathway protein F